MKNIILLVQSEEQAKALPAAGKVIGRLAPVGLWVLYSPILSIDATTATKELDAEVAAMEKAEKTAATVGDYETAKARRADRDRAMLNRSVAVRNAWKNVTPEDRKKHAARFLDPFLRNANPKNVPQAGWRLNQLPEHQDAEHWITTLNELRGTWHEGMKPGEFAVMWPSVLVEMDEPISTEQMKELKQKTQNPAYKTPADGEQVGVFVSGTTAASRAAKVPIPPLAFNAETRRTELSNFQPSRIISIAKIKGIKTKLKEIPAIIEEIIAAETAKAVAAM